MQLGIYSFAELTEDPATGLKISPAERMKNLLEEITLTEEVGLDVYAIGEHHRPDYIASSPAVILAAAAARTKKIRLSSAVSVLSSDDPVRVFQQYATLDLISNGRAEIMAGRGSFIESFPLFGYDLGDYHDLFAEKLDLLIKLRDAEKIYWTGQHRASLTGQGVYPRPVQNPIPIWVAVGGTPESVVRAANFGLPLAIAIIGGIPERFAPLVDLYRRALAEANQPSLPVGINSHGFIADTMQEAIDIAYPAHEIMMNRIGKERGWAPITKADFEASAQLQGAMFLGSPEQIAEKILYQYGFFHHQRFLLQLSVGTIPHNEVMKSIELYGTKVAPLVRQELAGRTLGGGAAAPF